ncbi:MAG: UTP--glucose-1-phosphate uridylyltransferase [Planctomycetota bacterium]|jgi:UDP-N-acetylglucosamine/UDP-N-acetylgalactosamine diphosphorylase
MIADDDTDRLARIRSTLDRYGQTHLLSWWDELDGAQRTELLQDIEQINFPAMTKLIDTHVRANKTFDLPKDIQPVKAYPARPDMDLVGQYADAVKRGISIIRKNQVAAFTVAGGQGTRLGFEGPKGACPISVVKNKLLFELFADYIIGTNRRYGSDLMWFIMTSPQNDSATRECFDRNNYFGLTEDRVHFFQQGVIPSFSPEGKILLDRKYRIAFSPDGHGGSLLALRRSGALNIMVRSGIEYISYFQVDNPLVKLIDPLFIGLHAITGSEMSSKTIPKADDMERVGNFVIGDGNTMVIEYFDFPPELAGARNQSGERLFDAASIAIHILSRSFVEKLTSDEPRFALDWHRAVKKVSYIDEQGKRAEPPKPNAVKLETFVFDAIPLARNPLILETIRSQEFSPAKNATGVDSLQTAKRDLNRRTAIWLEAAGFDVPQTDDGEPDGLFEISPQMALDSDHLREVMPEPPTMVAGNKHYWE